MDINGWQEQIILGSLLGSGFMVRSGSSINPRYYLGISETRDERWFRYKCQELGDFSAGTPVCRTGNAWKWRSRSGSNWDCFWKQFHDAEGNNSISMETLDRLRDIALAVWFGDKGFWYTNRRVGLRTGKFRDKNSIICDFFNQVGMKCELRSDTNGTTRCIFTRDGTLAFIATLGHRLPEFMAYRLDPQFIPEGISKLPGSSE